MSEGKFSDLVRNRWPQTRAAMGNAATVPVRRSSQQLVSAGQQALAMIAASSPAWTEDSRVAEVNDTLNIVAQGSEADRFTGLTRLNRLFDRMFMEDSDVSGMQPVVELRRELHLYLEH